MDKNKKNTILLITLLPISFLLIIGWNFISYQFTPTGCNEYSCVPPPFWVEILSQTLRIIFFVSIPISLYGLIRFIKNKKVY